MVNLKYNQTEKTEFDKKGNPIIKEIEFDELGRPTKTKKFWEF